MLCTCQVIFMTIQYPKIGWEPIYMASCECVLYGLASAGHGYVTMQDGRKVPWARMAAWTVTTPVLLIQIGGIEQVLVYNALALGPF